MLPRLCGISLSSFARLRSWKPSDSNIQELIHSVNMTTPTVWYFLNPERRHCHFWQWQPYIIDNDLSINGMYTHAQSEPFFNNCCFTDVFLKRAKLNCNNVSNALAVVHRVWCLSPSPNCQPWTKLGPLGHEMRPLENKMVKNKLLCRLLLDFISSDHPDWFPLIQKPDSRMNATWVVRILVARRDSVITFDSYHTRAHTVQAQRQTDKVTSLQHQSPP